MKKNIFKEFQKAYTEGIYADTPANRKLGRVGMTYQQYADKLKKQISAKEIKEEKEKLSEEQIKNIQEGFSNFCNSINFDHEYESTNNELRKSINILFPNSEVLIEKRKPYYGKSTFNKDTQMGYEKEVKLQYKGNEYKITFQVSHALKKSNIKISIGEGENYIHYYTLVENSSNYSPTVYKKNVEELFNKIQEQKPKYTKEDYLKQLKEDFSKRIRNDEGYGETIYPNDFFLNKTTNKQRLEVRDAKAWLSESKDVHDINYIKLNKAFEEKGVERQVKIKDILPTQIYLSLDQVAKYAEKPKFGIIGFKVFGTDKVALVNGHHRVAGLMLRGANEVPIKTITLPSKYLKDFQK